MTLLVEDVSRYSAYTIAGILMLLSSLRYPKSEESPQRDASTLWRLLRSVLRTMGSEMPASESAESVPDSGTQEGENLDD
jgi:hypothetical protein